MISNIRAIRVGSEVRISMRVSAARMLHRRSRAQRDQERREALRRNHENIRTQKSNGTIYQPFLCDVELKRGFVFPKFIVRSDGNMYTFKIAGSYDEIRYKCACDGKTFNGRPCHATMTIEIPSTHDLEWLVKPSKEVIDKSRYTIKWEVSERHSCVAVAMPEFESAEYRRVRLADSRRVNHRMGRFALFDEDSSSDEELDGVDEEMRRTIEQIFSDDSSSDEDEDLNEPPATARRTGGPPRGPIIVDDGQPARARRTGGPPGGRPVGVGPTTAISSAGPPLIDRTEETRPISIAGLMARRAVHVQDEPDVPMSDEEAWNFDEDLNETVTDSEDDEDDDNSISGDESIPILIDDY